MKDQDKIKELVQEELRPFSFNTLDYNRIKIRCFLCKASTIVQLGPNGVHLPLVAEMCIEHQSRRHTVGESEW